MKFPENRNLLTRKPDKVSRLLENSRHLDHLVRMLTRQQALLAEIRSQLPEPLATHCLHARIQGRELILHVDSPAWRSRLRFHAPALLKGLRAQAPHLDRVSVRVLAPEGRIRRGHVRRVTGQRHILPEAIEDEELRALLKR